MRSVSCFLPLFLGTALAAQPLSLSVNPDLSVRLQDARNGHTWNSAPPASELEDLNENWANFARAGVSVDYHQGGGLITRRTTSASEGSTSTLTPIPGGWRGVVTFGDTGIAVTVELTVAGDELRARVPAEGIAETGENKVARVWLLPFLGAVRGADPRGYLVLPDGPGTLVPFRDAAPAGSEAWVKPVWGTDMADGSEPAWNSWDKVQWPVFGLVREEAKAAWVAELVSGGELASVQAWPAGVTTAFTWLTASFQVRKTWVQPTARSGAGLTIVPAERQKTDLTVVYRFTSGPQATWLGLAQRVREAWAPTLPRRTAPASWNLTVLGSASTGQLVGRGEIVMTDATQARAIVREAAGFALSPGQVILHGWQDGGEGWGTPVTDKVGKGFGGPAGLKPLVTELKSLVPQVALTGHLMLATDGNPGWNPWTDPALRYNTTAMRYTFEYGPALTLLSPPAIQARADTWNTFATSLGAGKMLWDEGQLLSGWGGSGGGGRGKALEARKAVLRSLGTDLVLYEPASWALPSARSIVGFPSWSSGIRWAGESVPFLPNALRGLVALYGPDLNASPDLKNDLLRLLDFGLGLSVTITAEPAWKLEMSAIPLFSSTWSDWKTPLRDSLAWIAPALQLVQSQALVSRTTAPGPVVTETFADGHVLVINYRDKTWTVTR